MDHSIFFVVDLDELSKPTGIIIVNCFCISKGLQKMKSKDERIKFLNYKNILLNKCLPIFHFNHGCLEKKLTKNLCANS